MRKKLILFLTSAFMLFAGLYGVTGGTPVPEEKTVPFKVEMAPGSESGEIRTITAGVPAGLEDVVRTENLQAEVPFVRINNNIPLFSETDKKRTDAFETYSNLDALGRCGTAYANICKELMPTEPRGEIGQIKPSGWVQAKYEGIVNSKPPYLYNRCHLIGYQLAAENANERNLITGTRYLNVDGMLSFENMVADYVERTGNHVLYRVTPVFVGNELACRGVSMEAWSVEDSGKGICFYVFCPNVQPGVTIDYATGQSSVSGTAPAAEAESTVQAQPAAGAAVQTPAAGTGTENYVINTNTKKFHLPGCSSVPTISPKNRQDYTGTRAELESRGYTGCKKCIK